MPDEPGVPAGGGDQRVLITRLRAVIEAKDAGNALLRAELEAQLERYRRLAPRASPLNRNPKPRLTGSPEWTPRRPAKDRLRRFLQGNDKRMVLFRLDCITLVEDLDAGLQARSPCRDSINLLFKLRHDGSDSLTGEHADVEFRRAAIGNHVHG